MGSKGKVLVTGATGFIGGHVARRLINEGCDVRVLARETSNRSGLASLPLEYATGDITDRDSVISALKGCNLCVHCAAKVSDFGPWDEFRRINVGGLKNVLDAAVEADLERIVYFSTNDVLGIHTGGVTVNDDFQYKKTGYQYPDTKIEAETLFFQYVNEKGLKGVAVRPAWVYGPGDRTFLPEIVDALRKNMFFYFGSRKNVVCLAYIDNILDAVMLCLTNPIAVGRAYILSDGVFTPWDELITKIAEPLNLKIPKLQVPMFAAMGLAAVMESWAKVTKSKQRPMLTRYAAAITGSDMRYSNERIFKELGFIPKVLPDEGLKRSIEWLKTQDLEKIKKK